MTYTGIEKSAVIGLGRIVSLKGFIVGDGIENVALTTVAETTTLKMTSIGVTVE